MTRVGLLLLAICAAVWTSAPVDSGVAEGHSGAYGALLYAGRIDPRTLPEEAAYADRRHPRASARLAPAPAEEPATEAGHIDPLLSSSDPLRRAPPSVGTNFIALGSADNDFALVPPDPQLAVSGTRIIEMVNVKGRVFNKSGTALDTFTLASLFNVPSGWVDFDPKVIFDSISGRFFAAYVSFCDNSFPVGCTDQGRLHFGISTTANPLEPWDMYFIAMANDFPDYPGIGVTNDKVTVSFNRFDIDSPPGATLSPGCFASTGYCGAQTLVVQKSDLLAGVVAPTTFLTSPDTGHFTVRPAHSHGPVNTQYMASVGSGSSTSLHIFNVTGTPDAANVAVAHVAGHPAIASQESPCTVTADACARQMGTTDQVDSGDNRILDAVWRNNRMWFSANSACTPAGDTVDRACLRLIEVDTTSNAVLQDFFYGSAARYYFYPAVRSDGFGNLHVVYSRSSTTEFINTRVAGRLTGDAPNTMSGETLLKAGEVVFNPGVGGLPYRWGDYMGAAVDPSNTSVVWVVGQYARNDGLERWGTWIGRLQYPDLDNDGTLNGADPDDDNDTISDAFESACGSDPNDPTSIPERIDGGFAASDDDRDTVLNEALPGGASVADCDGDGYTGALENVIFAPALNRDQDPCGTDSWPPDLTATGPPDTANRVSLPDVQTYLEPVRRLNSSPPNPNFNRRWDLVPGGLGEQINVQDMQNLAFLTPPMLGGTTRAFNGPVCPWAP